ncbi:IclR-like transcriptional regulator, partial [Xenococcus sp. PCC 7305]|uniref:helix-turn-helix domain-containing protein n=1 Tax=Xenococcus sp. PCC 7305 TaxID=102125 RepID=UPI0002AC1984
MTGVTRVVIQESAEELKEKMNQQFQAKGHERLQALYLLKTGQCQQVIEVAAIVGRSRSTVHRWLHTYQEGGLARLIGP